MFFSFSYIFIFVSSPIGIISNEFSEEWLQWIGAFTGGSIGGIFAFVGIKITLENQRSEIQFENKKKALPLIDIKTGDYDYKNKYIQFDFYFTEESKKRDRKDIEDPSKITLSIENIGMRELYELNIGDIESKYFKTNEDYYSISPILYFDKSIKLNLIFYENGCYDNDNFEELNDTLISPISFKCYFRDCYDNWYHQNFSISLMHVLTSNVTVIQRALNVSFERCEVITQPIEISKKNLPWKKENSKSVCVL